MASVYIFDKFVVTTNQIIGQGSFGKIFPCYRKEAPDKKIYCAKYINKNLDDDDEQMEQSKKIIESEKNTFKIFLNIKNENLVQAYDLIEKEKHLIIINELCDYDLKKEFQIDKDKWFTQLEQINIIQQILMGAKALYDNKIIHRDIKPENILVKIINIGNVKKKIYKISDFGFCRTIDCLYKLENLTRVGTYTHMAPEIYRNEPFNIKCDIYSYGILFYQIVNHGQLPFPYQTRDLSQIYNFHEELMKNDRFIFQIPIKGKYGNMLMNLISKMIAFKQENRISFEELFAHEIFTQTYQIQEDSLFNISVDPNHNPQLTQQRLQSQIKKKDRVERIYKIQEVFQRKYQLCMHVKDYLNKTLSFRTLQTLQIQLLICLIGFQQIIFAFAVCHKIQCDIHQVFRENNENDNVILLSVFQDYCNQSKNDQKYQKQQDNIKQAYYSCRQNFQKELDKLIEFAIKESKPGEVLQSVFLRMQIQKIPIKELCHELEVRYNEQFKKNDWVSLVNSEEKNNILKICQFENKKFDVLDYQIINLDSIITI